MTTPITLTPAKSKDKLISRDFCLILGANFLLFFGFYLILPVLPFYLLETFHTSSGITGVVLSCYTAAALCIRPFSGYVLDTFSRKPLYILTYFIFAVIFVGYLTATYLTLFVLLRTVHGIAFGIVTVASNTIVVDIVPSSRRGEALGYYGLMGNIAMSIGPMVGLFMHNAYSFDVIFLCALVSVMLGFVIACLVHTSPKLSMRHEPISLDRFILLKGIPAGFSLLLISIPYGMTTSYIAIYAKEIGILLNTGLFFTFLATGMAVSRMFSGKQADKGRITQIILLGLRVLALCFFSLSACALLIKDYPQFTQIFFFVISIAAGIGFGTVLPNYNSLFINLAPHNKRATATSTYLISWDIGIGVGLIIGGFIAQYASYSMSYFAGACLTVVSILFFRLKVSSHFHKNKLQ
ncbi:Tetracycline resistance protein class B [termite gut metagenome]|uniref:Tetracycline resistance protein class B n=1 Tax=termite gut metagenome TaxID=433724 RepID=A0A5J4S0P7_9ZZZZ